MDKTKIGPQTILYPMPAALIGASVDNKANFMTAAWVSIVNMEPPMIGVAVRYERYTGKGIKQTRTFSVNIPSSELVKEVDYCGIVSGKKQDKAAICNFKIFYGELKTAPMIEQCRVNLECILEKTVNNESHELIIGKIVQVYVNKDCLTDGKPDVTRINPLIFCTGHELYYYELGRKVAPAFKVGKEFTTK